MNPQALAAVVAIAAPLLAQRTWVVDRNGGPGVNFTDIPPAIQAAAPGDRVFVRAGGSYSGFTLSKGLDLDAVTGTSVGASAVLGLPIGAWARLTGLSITSTGTAALRVEQCAGPVLLSTCSIAARNATAALHIADSQVLVVDCLCALDGFGPNPFNQDAALEATRSQLVVQRTVVAGADGVSANGVLTATPGLRGLFATDSIVIVSHLTASGGIGGNGYSTGGRCWSAPASGGHAVELAGGQALFMAGCRLSGGSPGTAPSPCPPQGIVGYAIMARGAGSAEVTNDCMLIGPIQGATRVAAMPTVSLPATAARGQPLTLSLSGVPGGYMMLFLDVLYGVQPIAGARGAFLLTPAMLPLLLLPLGPGGSRGLGLTVPLDPGLQDQFVFFQAVQLDLASPVPAFTDLGDLRIR